MNEFEAMKNFVRVVEAGSISKAADQLDLAKSGVSRRLADLEDRLGVRLLNRTTRRSSLTEAGAAYYQGAVRLLADVAELNSAAAGSRASLSGALRLSVPLSFGLRHLSPAIDEFMKANPDLFIKIDFSDRQVDLVGEGIDLAIRIAELGDSVLQARRICPVRLLLCASPGYLAEHGMPRSPDQLKQHRLLQYDIGTAAPLRLEDEEGKRYTVQKRPRVVANNGDFLSDMAVAGHGIILTPSFISWRAIASGELVQVLPGFRPRHLSAYAVYPPTRYLSRRARIFIDFLVQRFGENPYWDEFS